MKVAEKKIWYLPSNTYSWEIIYKLGACLPQLHRWLDGPFGFPYPQSMFMMPIGTVGSPFDLCWAIVDVEDRDEFLWLSGLQQVGWQYDCISLWLRAQHLLTRTHPPDPLLSFSSLFIWLCWCYQPACSLKPRNSCWCDVLPWTKTTDISQEKPQRGFNKEILSRYLGWL